MDFDRWNSIDKAETIYGVDSETRKPVHLWGPDEAKGQRVERFDYDPSNDGLANLQAEIRSVKDRPAG